MQKQRRRKVPNDLIEARALVRDIERGMEQHRDHCPQCDHNRDRPELWCANGYSLAHKLQLARTHRDELAGRLAAGQGALF